MDVDREVEEIRAHLGKTLAFNRVPVGWAVSTPMQRSDGDRFGFYLRRLPDGWTVEDDGGSIPHYVACGNDFRPGSAASDLMRRSRIDYDEDSTTLSVKVSSLGEVRLAAMRLLGLLCRLHFDALGMTRHFSPLVSRTSI